MLRFAFCLLYLGALGLLCFPFGRLLARYPYNPKRIPFRTYAFERDGAFYNDVFHIRHWQARVPDVSRWAPQIVPKKQLSPHLTAPQLRLMVNETCVAELTHLLLCLAAFALPAIWPGWGGWFVCAVDILLGNLPFIFIQRYQRPRLLRMLSKLERRERNLNHESADPELQ